MMASFTMNLMEQALNVVVEDVNTAKETQTSLLKLGRVQCHFQYLQKERDIDGLQCKRTEVKRLQKFVEHAKTHPATFADVQNVTNG